MKKQYALAAILAAALTFTGCEMPFEIRMKGDNSETTSKESQKSSKQSEKSQPSVESESSTLPDSSDNSKPESSPESSSKPNLDIDYEPVVNKCGDIKSNGDLQYFECSHEYGNACTLIYTYNFKNGIYDSVSLKIMPGAETELENIINSYMINATVRFEVSDFTETAGGWVMVKEDWLGEDEAYFEGIDIDSMYSMMELLYS